jgi:YD repeat-containing protein
LIKLENIGGYGNSPTEEYSYNNRNQMISKRDNLKMTTYEYDDKGNKLTEVVYLSGKKIAEYKYLYLYWK